MLSPMATPGRRRVKVYKLNSVGDWDDLGTGFVECRTLEEACSPSCLLRPRLMQSL